MSFLLSAVYAAWWFIFPLVLLSWFLYALERRKENRAHQSEEARRETEQAMR
ncbi:hypothetical protein KIV66_gp59 [Mycobacterium phage MyraDee]|uniref:Uncharacterized protein n=1 Tax=Mycobacterium phage MyraDee TaxID=2024303 RepID=A0A222Z089_9CAUD|nr:hypothetical protein KIV66_gp59 [Mycobacterium phage MyraDee]ASR77166.1 hypothetical protein SEA_MYRADEE_59 [Mycobacterium phage MyraDee]